jgi:WD40 repeat protein
MQWAPEHLHFGQLLSGITNTHQCLYQLCASSTPATQKALYCDSSALALLIPAGTASHPFRACLQAHDSDVNVISWNRLVAYMLASGSDDGGLKIWDLRSFTSVSGRPISAYTIERPAQASMLLKHATAAFSPVRGAAGPASQAAVFLPIGCMHLPEDSNGLMSWVCHAGRPCVSLQLPSRACHQRGMVTL